MAKASDLQDSNKMKFVSLTEMAKARSEEPKVVIANWLRARSTIKMLIMWEKSNNPTFDYDEANSLLNKAGSNSFSLSPKKWIETTGAIGITSKAGRNGGTYARWEIAMQFLSAVFTEDLSVFIQAYQHGNHEQWASNSLDWDAALHDIGDFVDKSPMYGVAPERLSWKDEFDNLKEEDVVSMAIFGMTHEQFEVLYPNHRLKMHEGTHISQIITHLFLCQMNEEMIGQCVSKKERFARLNEEAVANLSALRLLHPQIKT